ncbi:MAG: hypothetical protein WBD53_17985, partial [Xanthobacteraceae bacterium]
AALVDEVAAPDEAGALPDEAAVLPDDAAALVDEVAAPDEAAVFFAPTDSSEPLARASRCATARPTLSWPIARSTRRIEWCLLTGKSA